jgi:hypothetical protein
MGRFTRITVLVCRNCQGIGQVDCTAALYRQDAGQGDIVGVEGMLDYPSAEIQADMQIKYPDAYDDDLTPIIARTVVLPFILPALMYVIQTFRWLYQH